MLEITIPASDFFDSNTQCFVSSAETVLTLEHSLLSISKWEASWNLPLISTMELKKMTNEMFFDYVKCMTIGKQASDLVYQSLTPSLVKTIGDYMNAPMTATTIKESGKRAQKRIVTSELVYYWMIASGIPFECQKWHINRLLTLIQVCSAENSPKKKMKKRDILEEYMSQNALRKSRLNSKG